MLSFLKRFPNLYVKKSWRTLIVYENKRLTVIRFDIIYANPKNPRTIRGYKKFLNLNRKQVLTCTIRKYFKLSLQHFPVIITNYDSIKRNFP